MSDLSRFIRTASGEEKSKVYGEVMDAASCRQALSVIVAALADFDGMDEPPMGYSHKLDRLRVAYKLARKALGAGE